MVGEAAVGLQELAAWKLNWGIKRIAGLGRAILNTGLVRRGKGYGRRLLGKK